MLATKVYQPMGLGPNDRRLSAYHIRRACEASLRRLSAITSTCIRMHHVDRTTPWEEIWQAMERLVRDGKVTYVGSSNFAAWDVALAQTAPSARHFVGPLRGVVPGLGAEPANVALACLLCNPVVSTAIVGATTPDELRSDLGALSLELDTDVIARLDLIWPGPGEAPQAYSW